MDPENREERDVEHEKEQAGGEHSSRDAGSSEGPRTAPRPDCQPAEN